MNHPLVSIIVPVYNAQNSVARCLKSLCAQTWKNIEIILINDGSRDESYSICESFCQKDPRIVLVDKNNTGVSDTRNCGLSLAQGDYVQFVDSDDYIEPDFTEHLVTAAEKNHADLVISPYWMVIPANSTKMAATMENLQENLGLEPEKKPDEIHEYGFLPEGVYDRDTFALRLMDMPASFFYSVLWNKLYRRDIVVRNALQFTSEVRGQRTWSSIWTISCTRRSAFPFQRRATTMCRTPRAFCTRRSTRLPSCRTSCRCSSITKRRTQNWACMMRSSRSCTVTWSPFPRAAPRPAR